MPFQGSLYLADHLADHATRRAREAFGGKMNTFIAHLVARDKNGGGALLETAPEVVAAWQAADRALLTAAPVALKVLHLPDQESREAAAKELALKVIAAAMRPGVAEAGPAAEPMAAEAPAPYLVQKKALAQSDRRRSGAVPKPPAAG